MIKESLAKLVRGEHLTESEMIATTNCDHGGPYVSRPNWQFFNGVTPERRDGRRGSPAPRW